MIIDMKANVSQVDKACLLHSVMKINHVFSTEKDSWPSCANSGTFRMFHKSMLPWRCVPACPSSGPKSYSITFVFLSSNTVTRAVSEHWAVKSS